MGKISIKKVISDVRDAYVDLTGDTDEITYGNISEKISEIETGGGIKDGYTVKFVVNDEDYYIASCDSLTNTITEPPVPTKAGYAFVEWQNEGEDPIEFPYFPFENEETLYAKMVAVRTDMEIKTKNAPCYWASYPSSADRTKGSFGTMICGMINNASMGAYFMALAKTENACKINRGATPITTGTTEYDGETYYYTFEYVGNNFRDVNPAFVEAASDYTTEDAFATAILDLYYGKE